MTLAQLKRDAIKQLARYYPDTAEIEIEILIKQCFELTSAELINIYHKSVDKQKMQVFYTALQRRLKHEPLDYIIGNTHFLTGVYNIRPGVLVPRSETEILVQTAQEHIQTLFDGQVLGIEYGFGSGVISIELAKVFPKSKWVAFDPSTEAYACATSNAKQQGITTIEWINESFNLKYSSIQSTSLPRICIANPPYIPSNDIATLETSVSQYEPHAALDGGPTGLDAYHIIFKACAEQEIPLICLECGVGQSKILKALAAHYTYRCCNTVTDMQGIERVMLFEPN